MPRTRWQSHKAGAVRPHPCCLGRFIATASARQAAAAALVLPKVAESFRGKFGISNRMLDVLVAEIVLQRPGVHALVGQLEPGCMSQHVRMDSERHLGGPPKPRHHPAKGYCRHRGSPLTYEEI